MKFLIQLNFDWIPRLTKVNTVDFCTPTYIDAAIELWFKPHDFRFTLIRSNVYIPFRSAHIYWITFWWALEFNQFVSFWFITAEDWPTIIDQNKIETTTATTSKGNWRTHPNGAMGLNISRQTDLSENTYLKQFVGKNHIPATDNEFWHAFLQYQIALPMNR